MSALTELARLPERQRQAMVETVGGMARSEVASTMGLSEGAVRQLVHRARSTLRTAVTAVTPWPMARWFAALGQSTPGSAELAAGAGAASSGGIALKLGALIASGTLATGVAAVDLHGARPHHPATRAATPRHEHASVQRAAPLVVAAAVSAPHSVGARRVEASLTFNRTDAVPVRVDLRRGRQEPGDVRSGSRHDSPGHSGRGTGRHDGGPDGSSSGEGAGGRGGQSGQGDSSSSGSSTTQPQDGSGGQDSSRSGGDGSGRDGSGSDGGAGGGHDSSGSSGSIASAGSSQDRRDLTSAQPVVDSSHDGSGSGDPLASGIQSGNGGGSSDSVDGSAGASVSGSHDGGSSGN
jgi:hypothetical protein